MASFSINNTYAGKHVLLTGSSGFLGKVWLGMMLERVPEIGRIYLLIRKKGLRPASDRFDKMVNSSFVFKKLHEQYGEKLSAFISQRVEVVEGDVTQPNFGLNDADAARLRDKLDLIVNCAGLVDFNPDLRDALATNVNGGVYAAEFTEQCKNAALLHVSTCYVVGNRSGLIEETVDPTYCPSGLAFDPEAELVGIQERIEQTIADMESSAGEEALKAEVLAKIRDRGLDETNATLIRNMTHRERQQRVKSKLATVGEERALTLGWPNTYTYTKSLSEALMVKRHGHIRHTLFRPAIVESSLSYPFPGWNEGFNTCGPLTYLLQTWFRHIPGKQGNPFDVIPVDLVCNGITIAGAALLRGEQKPVYQCGTSDKNVLTIDRACDLVGLSHRRHLRKTGTSAFERIVLSRMDARTVEGDYLLSVPNLRSLGRGLSSAFRSLADKAPTGAAKTMNQWANATDDADKQLDIVEKMLDLFRPFIHDNRFVFECKALNSHEIEEKSFQFNPEAIDWRDYWLNVHIPGLRRWSYPAIEGKRVETYTPQHKFSFTEARVATAPPVAVKREVG